MGKDVLHYPYVSNALPMHNRGLPNVLGAITIGDIVLQLEVFSSENVRTYSFCTSKILFFNSTSSEVIDLCRKSNSESDIVRRDSSSCGTAEGSKAISRVILSVIIAYRIVGKCTGLLSRSLQ